MARVTLVHPFVGSTQVHLSPKLLMCPQRHLMMKFLQASMFQSDTFLTVDMANKCPDLWVGFFFPCWQSSCVPFSDL